MKHKPKITLIADKG